MGFMCERNSNSSCDHHLRRRDRGTVTRVPSPTLGLGIGYVKFKTQVIGLVKMKLRFSDGNEYVCSIVGLPFFDKIISL